MDRCHSEEPSRTDEWRQDRGDEESGVGDDPGAEPEISAAPDPSSGTPPNDSLDPLLRLLNPVGGGLNPAPPAIAPGVIDLKRS